MTTAPSIDRMIVRYLGALGPASVMDAHDWSGLTRLGEVFERLRPGLVTFRTEGGRELFDVPDTPRADADVRAPIRFLPQYDNLLLGHADRSRIIPAAIAALPWPSVWVGSILVDRMAGGIWRVDDAGLTATIVVEPRVTLTPAQRVEVESEAASLVAFLRPNAAGHGVRFVDSTA